MSDSTYRKYNPHKFDKTREYSINLGEYVEVSDMSPNVKILDPDSRTIDYVNNPPHYNAGSVECIQGIQSALTEEEFRGYCKGNALKYIWREQNKGGETDLKKAIWYLDYLSTSKQSEV